jgi:hypothetical protein
MRPLLAIVPLLLALMLGACGSSPPTQTSPPDVTERDTATMSSPLPATQTQPQGNGQISGGFTIDDTHGPAG